MRALGEAAQFGKLGAGEGEVRPGDRHEVDLLASQPGPEPVRGHGDGPLPKEGEADRRDGRDHGNAQLPRVEDHERVLAAFREHGGDPRGPLGRGTVHEGWG